MVWTFDNNKPIYLQIVHKLKLQIIQGTYKEGDKLPSVRDFAVMVGVNPNTMQRAFAELEQLSLVESQRTTGRFITKDKEVITNMKNELAKQTIDEFLKSMKELNISKDEIIEFIKHTD